MENELLKELISIKKQLEELKALVLDLIDRPHPILGEWISEYDLKRLLKKGTTWCWDMRKKGLLDHSKLGAEVFYSVESLKKLMEDNKVDGYRKK